MLLKLFCFMTSSLLVFLPVFRVCDVDILLLVLIIVVEDDAVVIDESPNRHAPLGPGEELRH